MLDKNSIVFANVEKSIINIIDSLSPKEKRNITVRALGSKILLGELEIQSALDKMVEQGKLERSYTIKCPSCGEEIYISELGEREFICEECEYSVKNNQIKGLLIDIIYSVINIPKDNCGINYSQYFNNSDNKKMSSVINLQDKIKEVSKIKGEKEDMNEDKKIEKIFISHAFADKEYVDLLVQLLNDIGIEKSADKIFYSSMPGYGIPLAENIYDYLKEELNRNIMVIFVLSDNYYNSPACLNEMGATWISNKAYYTVLLPNFEFTDIKGAINPMDMSFKIEDKNMLNEFKDKIVKEFNLKQIDNNIWEEDRDKFISNIKEIDKKYKSNNQKCKIEIDRVKGKGTNDIEIAIRFINNGNKNEECQEITFNLIDEDNQKISINAPDEFFEDKIIYPGENRREVIVVKNTDDRFMHKRIKESYVEFRWV